MLTKKEVMDDLEYMCAKTNAHYLFYDNIHTVDYQKDAEIFIKEMGRLGYSKNELLSVQDIKPAYCGGVEINHKEEEKFSGYTVFSKRNQKKLVLLYGVETDLDHHTVYHECAHLYQKTCNIFTEYTKDDYVKYLMEIHANTFASMVLLLKAKNVLEYKKYRLCRLASGLKMVNDERREAINYTSMPVELALMKEIRKKGRLNTVREFSKDGHLDFKKILFYTQKLVEKYAYSREEFEAIRKGNFVPSYDRLKRKAKALRIVGKAYSLKNSLKYRKKVNRHYQIEKKRTALIKEKMQNLPCENKECDVINAICLLDTFQVTLVNEYGVADSIQSLINGNEKPSIPDNLKEDYKRTGNIEAIFDKMKKIYEMSKGNQFFNELLTKVDTIEGRDEIWALKEQKKKEIMQKRLMQRLQRGR